jgi:3-phenylpropionate/trans-cinnamate dioxygenase ferredoxin subunit
MANFQTVAKTSDVAPGKLIKVAGDVVIANVDGEFFAFSCRCPHDNGPLDKGSLSGDIVMCPLHFAQFNVRTGEPLKGGVTKDSVPTYELRLEGDEIQISKG